MSATPSRYNPDVERHYMGVAERKKLVRRFARIIVSRYLVTRNADYPEEVERIAALISSAIDAYDVGFMPDADMTEDPGESERA